MSDTATVHELKVTIRNPEAIATMAARLAEASREMASLNVNFNPIRNQTKDRWQAVMDDASLMLSKLIGQR